MDFTHIWATSFKNSMDMNFLDQEEIFVSKLFLNLTWRKYFEQEE